MPPRDYTTPTLDPIEDITRRRLLTALPALGLIAGGISCGDDDDDEATPTEAPTRTFTDSLGRTVEIPPKPQRIVSLHVYTSAPALLSIGAPVLGIPLDRGVVDAIQPYDLSNIIDVGGFEPNLEAIASLDPDLIIGLAGADGRPAVEGGVAEQIQSIAPSMACIDALERGIHAGHWQD
ncbi:MAG: ABC transporter substrate-binding protein [Dehalococcoidia bacterium]|nr:ABC transporter substrate-binding protein [Dehalococcoidia bacterium]